MADRIVYHSLTGTLRSYWPALAIGLLLLRAIYRRYLHPLHTVPGPFLASITSLWYLAHFLGNSEHHRDPIKLHARYGPLIRIRPNTVLINDPKDFDKYFTWPRSEFFRALRGHPEVVGHGGEMELEAHNVKKRMVMGGFTMSNVLKNESTLDGRVMEFMGELTKRSKDIIDISPWTQFATFDIATEMIFGKPVGFMKAGLDVDGIVAALHDLFTVVAVTGLYPWMAKLLWHPWIYPVIGPKPTDKTGPGAFHGFAYKTLAQRVDQADPNTKHPDIMQWILDHPDKDGQHISRPVLEQEAISFVLAGSDTTASTLRAIILAVSSNPRILNKLRQQIDAADALGLLSTPPTYDQTMTHIPYLEFLFKEAQRAYPIVGMPLPRSVPKPGAQVSGHFLPAGTEVSMSQWAVGYNPHIYGEDLQLFRPERWSDDLSHDPTTQKRRSQAEVWFSGGPMKCTGRNVATLEVYKITAQFYRMFDVEVVNAHMPWREKAEVTILHSDFLVKLTERKRAD